MKFTNVVMVLGVAVATLSVANAAPDDTPGSSKDVVLVEINGTTITQADLEKKNPSALFNARTSFYEAERQALDGFIQETVLQMEAKKEGLTVDQLIDKHVKTTIAPDPSEESLRVYYEGVQTTEPYEAVRGKILDAIRESRIAKAQTAYLQSLRGKYAIVLRLPPPRTTISMANVPIRGASNAPITLLEYADFECPYCQQIAPIISRLEVEYKGKIQFAYKDYPLGIHANAEKAAEAAHCAGAQGKYWEFHDLILSEKHPEPAALKGYARDLKLDAAAFDKCLETGGQADVVKTSQTEAKTMGLQGTPTFFVNGRYVSGNASYERLRAVIEEELSAAQAQNAGSAGKPAARGGQQDQ
jgi:protein-disulfide isomerase